MKRIVALATTLLGICWVALNVVSTLIPPPDQLLALLQLPNDLRLLLYAAAPIGAAVYLYPSHFSWRGLKTLLGIGISWEVEHCLGMTGTPTKITGFQLFGFNNSRHKTLSWARARLITHNAGSIPLQVTTSDAAMDHAPKADVAPRTRIQANVEFGEMVAPEDFIAECAPLALVFWWSGGISILFFSKRAIAKQIRRFERGG